MKHVSLFLAVLFAFSSSVFSQNGWGWGNGFEPSITANGLTIVLPVSAWQRTDAPADTKDNKMQSKRFSPAADIVVKVFYNYLDENGNTVPGEKFVKAKVDWSTNSVTVSTGIRLPSTGSFTVVGKVPGYNTAEDESVFINENDPYATRDEKGKLVYRFRGDFKGFRVAKYNG
jgi:hypothetical protein